VLITDEKEKLVKFAIDKVSGKIPVILNNVIVFKSSNNTRI